MSTTIKFSPTDLIDRLDLRELWEAIELLIAGDFDKEAGQGLLVNLIVDLVDWEDVLPGGVGALIEDRPVERVLAEAVVKMVWGVVEGLIEKNARKTVERGHPVVDGLTRKGRLAVLRRADAIRPPK